MKTLQPIFVATLFFCFSQTEVQAQLSPTVNIQFRSNLPFVGQTCANICGYAANGKEYALVGNRTGTGIVDVTDPTMPILLKQVTALNSQWREIKVYRNYAYVTTEATGQGLQIIDLTKLSLPVPDVDVKSFTGPDGDLVAINKIHSLHIDTTNGFLYAFGGNSTINVGGTNTAVDGAVVLDIKTDPWNPHYVGKFSNSYIHDGFVINDTLYGAHIRGGGYFSIIDFRNKTMPVIVNTQTTPTAFTHNTWRSDDGKTIFTTDENAGSYVGAYDVSDPSNIRLLDRIRSPAVANAIVHNTHFLNGYLLTSWYTEGMTIVDAHRPQNLVQVGQYDTYDGSGAIFAGAWGVYPYLPSGNLIVSNITSGQGLFVLTPQYVRACYLEGLVTDISTGLPLLGVSVTINSTDMDKKATSNNIGNYYTGQVTPGTFTVTYAKSGYVTQTLTGIVLSNGSVTLQNVQLVPIIVPVELVDIKAKRVDERVQLVWETASETKTKSFDIERSTKEMPLNFVKMGEVKANGQASFYLFYDAKPISSTHYYRLKINADNALDNKNDYSKVVSVQFNTKTDIKVTPSVTKGILSIENGEFVEVFNNFGQLVFVQKLSRSVENINLSFLHSGQYIVRIQNGFSFSTFKILKVN